MDMGATMKKYRWFISILFIGFGLFYFASQQQYPALIPLYDWYSILFIIGLACLFQAYAGHDQHYIIPGILLTGFGIHFCLSTILTNYPNPYGVLTMIVAVSLFLKNKRSKGDLLPSILLCLISLFFFFSQQLDTIINQTEFELSLFQTYWPLLLVGIGICLLFFKRKRY